MLSNPRDADDKVLWSVYLSLCLCLSHPWPRRLSKAVFYFLRKKCNWGLLVGISVYLPVCFSKSTRGEKPVEDIPIFTYTCVGLWVFGLYGTSWPNEKRYRPEIWFTHSPKPYLKTFFFCFFRKSTLRVASFEKSPVSIRFPHISSIVLFVINFTFILNFPYAIFCWIIEK